MPPPRARRRQKVGAAACDQTLGEVTVWCWDACTSRQANKALKPLKQGYRSGIVLASCLPGHVALVV